MQPIFIKSLLSLSFFLVHVTASVNFTDCLAKFKNDSDATLVGGTDWQGNPVNHTAADALTYDACTSYCGTGAEAFDWSIFSQQFSAWLLPWLALVSQLPFGAETRLDNFISVALTVGSPSLAAFSLAITALNTRWASDRFSEIKYPNREKAAKALIYLQQVPLRVNTREGLLASLIVLPKNDDWWECLVDRLEQTYTWSIATATSIAWVIVAFLFTLVDSFMSLGENVNESGQAVGTLWLWLVPLVVGWLWVPVCSYDKMKNAINKANDIAYLAIPDDHLRDEDPPAPGRVPDVSHKQAITIYRKRKVFTRDASRSATIFNYSRIWEWSYAVETIARAFESADKKAKKHESVVPGRDWVYVADKQSMVHPDNRIGTVGQVQAYCDLLDLDDEEPSQPRPSGTWKRIFVASSFALGLQWATTGSATMTVFFTPTSGLGCRSGTYLLYGLVSTTVWLMFLLSSYLAHCAKLRHDNGNVPPTGFNSADFAEGLAKYLRLLATFGAICNAVSVILADTFQFSKFYSTCYCNSSVLGRGARQAYNIIASGYDYTQVRAGWIGAVVLAGGYVAVFLLSLDLILESSNETIHS